MLYDKISRAWRWLKGRLSLLRGKDNSPPGDYVMGRPRRKQRTFYFGKRRNWGRCLMAAVFGVILIVSSVKLISYGVDYYNAQQASASLREIYHAEEEATAEPTNTPAPATPPTAAPTAPPEAGPTATPPTRLQPVRYPGNFYANVSSRFQKVRRQNSDIIGWLTIDGLIDEAVVQRDNEYYLDRDYRGYHNVNGAIFLDETCDLDTRPYTLLLYGHNMKTGAMFGSLRNYENLTFYRNNPFITFDTAYEDGRYVIFAVATVSTTSGSWRYVDVPRCHRPSLQTERMPSAPCSVVPSTVHRWMWLPTISSYYLSPAWMMIWSAEWLQRDASAKMRMKRRLKSSSEGQRKSELPQPPGSYTQGGCLHSSSRKKRWCKALAYLVF